ncbi:hypothetical protein ACFL1S_05625 [Pseudomonadota bacterium]
MKFYSRLPAAVFILINCLFLYKYASRLTDYFLLIIIAYILAAGSLLILLDRIPLKKFTQIHIFLILGIFLISALIIFRMISIDTLNVDRWSVIASFWDTAFHGLPPYSAISIHDNSPGPFPFYFVLALPFHLIGEIGWMTVLAMAGLAWILVKRSNSIKPVVILLLLLSTAPATLWELSTRSTILVNMTMVIIFLTWLEYSKDSSIRNQIITGLIGGLILSTRGFAAIPMLAFFTFAYIRTGRIAEFFIRGSALAVGFLITLLPFLFWEFDSFMQYNPIVLQAGFLNLPLLIIFFFSAVIIGLKSADSCSFYRNLSLFLVVVISAAFILTILEHGWNTAFHQNTFDISYYILALPFLIMACPTLKQEQQIN